MEIWKDIPNYNGYQVSNLGRVRTYNKTTFTKKHGIRHWKNRILKQKATINKYGRKDKRVELWQDGKHKTYLVARLVGFTFNNIDLNSKLTIDHLDGDSTNNRLDNLDIISLNENISRAFEKGLYKVCKKIKITHKKTNDCKEFISMNKASEYIKKNHGYISCMIKQNKFENKDYKWEIINNIK